MDNIKKTTGKKNLIVFIILIFIVLLLSYGLYILEIKSNFIKLNIEDSEKVVIYADVFKAYLWHIFFIFSSILFAFGFFNYKLLSKILKTLKNHKDSIEVERNKLKELNAKQEEIIAQKTKRIYDMNIKLSKIVKQELQKSREKDRILFHQAKMATIGEMIENIAHQWRQPLSFISSVASGLKLKLEMGMFNSEEAQKELESIVDKTSNLSNTIDNFRSFFAPNSKKENFDIKMVLDNLKEITSDMLREHNIKLIYDIKVSVTIYNYQNELTQILLTIFTNARDILLEKNQLKEKIIKLSAYKENNNIVIEVIDNGGGVDEKIIDKIFEPYFTTKHKASGVGIGLYMALEIIKRHIKGSISVENSSFEYQNKEYFGAKFKIVVPI